MSQAEFTLDFLVYSDADASNDPQQRDFDYKKTLSISDLSNPSLQVLELTAAQATSITLPASTCSWCYIETDQTIHARFNGDSTTNNQIDPSEAGESDGVFFKRGSITSLSINVPGADNANVRIFLGA